MLIKLFTESPAANTGSPIFVVKKFEWFLDELPSWQK
ncbi:unnamed protein product [Brugia timori]|uniref:Reverse transcriptase n=1 Tax=Brugia timori TaxID=42155 RepID=A0A0R3QCR5_9BILA|nr:unnamed protein product [Brugia timori]